MNYIVFDLEWNQSPGGKKYSNSRLPFEIIEIGAVKLDDNREPVDVFHRLIKPQVYSWIHDSIHDVIHMDYKDLMNGDPFEKAAADFLDWCGEEKCFFTWGNQDMMELQRNMKYYGLLSRLPGPVLTYYDIQKIYGIFCGDNSSRRSLEAAVDELGIVRQEGFHRALADARYTAEVVKRLDFRLILDNFSMDVYQNPKNRKEEVHYTSPDYEKYVSREFADREKVMKDREVLSTRCPACRLLAKRKIRWFSNHSRVYESVSCCKKHGYVYGRLRIRHTEEDQYFAVKTLTLIDEKKAEDIRMKRDALREKRQEKRQLASSDKSRSANEDC